jgi:hypothetical protein
VVRRDKRLGIGDEEFLKRQAAKRDKFFKRWEIRDGRLEIGDEEFLKRQAAKGDKFLRDGRWRSRSSLQPETDRGERF